MKLTKTAIWQNCTNNRSRIEVLQNWPASFLVRGKYERIDRNFKTEKSRLRWHKQLNKHTSYPLQFDVGAGILVCQVVTLWFLEIFVDFSEYTYELHEQFRECFDANIDEESNHFQEIPEEIYEDSDGIKGQLISEWLFDGFNFPKNQCKNLMNFCLRI